ncbi:MAG: hypothetical protein E2O40_01605 [Planctomycetota bacterium]|nr:MAG: hypothetical protein E2O40_01605 [Planctomycetota bacterium]
MRPTRGICVLLGTAMLLPACTGGGVDETAPGSAVETRIERGPVTLTVRAEPAAVVVGEPFRLVIEVVAALDVAIEMPDPPTGDLGPFAVRLTQTPPDVPVAEGRRYRHTWTLDTFSAGLNEIPGVTVTFVDRRPGTATPAGPIEGELVSEPLSITVHSVLAPDQTEHDLRDIKSEVRDFLGADLASLWPAAVAIGIGLAVAVLAVIMTRRRRRLASQVPVIAPGVWAQLQLDELERRKLLDQGRVHEFYFQLSSIVRRYLERRFKLMAPEQTTEEFLRETRRSDVLTDDHKHLLSDFLRAADMVKFALHEPSATESGLAMTAARGFVEQTADTADTGEIMETAA